MVVKYFFFNITGKNTGCDLLIFFKYIGIRTAYPCALVIFRNILHLLLDCVNPSHIHPVDKK